MTRGRPPRPPSALSLRAAWVEPRRARRPAERAARCPRWPAALDGLRVGAARPTSTRACRTSAPARVERVGDAAGGRAARPGLPARRLHRLPRAFGGRSTRRARRAAARRWRGAARRRRRARQPRLVRGRAAGSPGAAGAGIPVLENDGRARWATGLWVAGVGDYRIRGARMPAALAGARGRGRAAALPRSGRLPATCPARVAPHRRRAPARRPGQRPAAAAPVGALPLRRALPAGHVVEDGRHLYVSSGLGTSRLRCASCARPRWSS